MAVITVFLLNYPPNNTIDGDTLQITECSANTPTCPFYGLLEPIHIGTVKRILR